jgi:gamma-glutamyltranspeptidase / glutathione hydrolase
VRRPTTGETKTRRGAIRANRPTIVGREYVVVAGHPLACVAGQRMLEAGGNAFDAGVAAGIANNVLQPDIAHFGGIAPIILYHAASGRVHTVQGVGPWPRAASIGVFQERAGGEIPHGVLRSVVPAAPSAWLTALGRFGTMTLGEVAAPAIALAEQGFQMHDALASSIRRHRDGYAAWPSSAAIFLPRGRSPLPGELFIQRDLGTTLRTMVDAERRAAGGREAGIVAAREAFYRGRIGEQMVRFCRSQGGLLDIQDLASLTTPVLPPVHVTYHGLHVHGCGPWSQGPVLLQTLKLLEPEALDRLRHNSADHVHLVTEALKLAFADRERYYGDPEFVHPPMDRLLSDAYAAERRRLIDPLKAWPGLPPSGDAMPRDGGRWEGAGEVPAGKGASGEGDRPVHPDTSYLCTIDRQGNIFSATFSDPSYDSPVVPDLGIPISSRGSQAWLDPEHPNCVQAGKRPMITPNPVLVLKEGRPYMAIGSPGGDVQPQAMVQVLCNLLHFGMRPQEAVEAPRFSTYSVPDSFFPHSYEPGVLRVEAEFSRRTLAGLAARGHTVEIRSKDTYWLSGAVGISIRDEQGMLSAGADPRREGYAIAW